MPLVGEIAHLSPVFLPGNRSSMANTTMGDLAQYNFPEVLHRSGTLCSAPEFAAEWLTESPEVRYAEKRAKILFLGLDSRS